MSASANTPEPRSWPDRQAVQADLDDHHKELLARDPSEPVPAPGVGVLELLIVSLLVAAAAVATYHFVILPGQLPRLATVDLPAIYREQEAAFTKVVSRDGLTEREREAAFARAEAFARELPSALESLSQECRCTLLAGNAVAGRYAVLDLTAVLRRKVVR